MTSVTFVIPAPLRGLTGGEAKVLVDDAGPDVRSALARLWSCYPGLEVRITTEQGEVRPHVNVFVGTENIRDSGGLAAPIADGVEIAIIPAVSGGRLPSQ